MKNIYNLNNIFPKYNLSNIFPIYKDDKFKCNNISYNNNNNNNNKFTFAANQITNSNFFYPVDIKKIYNFPEKYTGKGVKIATIIFNCNVTNKQINDDVQLSFNDQKITTKPSINLVNINNAKNFDPNGYHETALDVQIISSIAPEAEVTVYNFDYNNTQQFFSNIHASITRAINDGVNIISISLAGNETLKNAAVEKLLNTARLKNINIYVSTGDYSGNNKTNGFMVTYLSSSPNVIACGGTSLSINNGNISETVWNNNNNIGTGGGYSKYYKKPSYQNTFNKTNMRGLPDVSGNADPKTGYKIYIDGKINITGGTSAVAPLMAGLNGLLNEANGGKSIGFLNNIIYNNPSIFYDITQGNNYPDQNNKLGYVASTGWDACTGLGRIDGTKLLDIITKNKKNIAK